MPVEVLPFGWRVVAERVFAPLGLVRSSFQTPLPPELLPHALDVDPDAAVVIVPARLVGGLAWAGLPSLADSAITVAPIVSGAITPYEMPVTQPGSAVHQ